MWHERHFQCPSDTAVHKGGCAECHVRVGIDFERHAIETLTLARFSYVDTLKILQKFGPGAIFYGRGDQSELDDLEARLVAGGPPGVRGSYDEIAEPAVVTSNQPASIPDVFIVMIRLGRLL